MQALADMDNIVVAGSVGDDIGKQCGGWTITWQGQLEIQHLVQLFSVV
ncbi:MAG: hypothetical protein ACLRQF_08575 [Thomasclavelia ramosa]